MTYFGKIPSLAAVYGPAAHFSEYRRGHIIRYHENNIIHQGVVVWVCAPEVVAEGREPLGLRYIVENAHHERPDVVVPSNIIAGTIPDTLVTRSLGAVHMSKRIGPLTFSLDTESGELHFTTLDTAAGTTLSAQEAYELLTWLSEYRNTLHQATHQDEKE